MTAMNYPGSRGAIIANTYKNLEDYVIPTLTEDIWVRLGHPEAWDELVESFNKNDLVIKFKNGSKIYLRSCERPGNLRGPNLSWFFIDEAAKVPYLVWKIMVGRIRIAPEKGWITTTPRGRNWVWYEFEQKPSKKPTLREMYQYFKGSTDENLTLSKDYKDSLKESYSGNFLQQEYYGEFVGWEGLVYQLNPDKHFVEAPDPTTDAFRDRYRYAIAGVDWGWIEPSCIVVGLVGFDGQIHLVDEFYQNKVEIDDIVKTANELKDKWNIRTFYCDSARPEYIDKLRQGGCDARKGKKELDPGIAIVNKYLSTKDEEGNDREPLLIMDEVAIRNTINEFEVYHYEEDDMGTILKNKPVDADNHAMDAVRYLVYSHSRVGYVGSARGR